jgi:hypothetical protein
MVFYKLTDQREWTRRIVDGRAKPGHDGKRWLFSHQDPFVTNR